MAFDDRRYIVRRNQPINVDWTNLTRCRLRIQSWKWNEKRKNVDIQGLFTTSSRIWSVGYQSTGEKNINDSRQLMMRQTLVLYRGLALIIRNQSRFLSNIYFISKNSEANGKHFFQLYFVVPFVSRRCNKRDACHILHSSWNKSMHQLCGLE